VNGTVPEYLVNEENALIVDRDHNSFRLAVEKLRDSPSLRKSLGRKARETVLEKFCWEKKALDFKSMFEATLNKL
jgi:glycosyltransferase involved in cell wall biosynthesis